MSDYDNTGQIDRILKKRNELNDLIDIRFKRPVTILITDIVDFTKSLSARGDAESRRIIQRRNNLLAVLIAQNQGNLIEITGDTILAFFGRPANAVACAVRMQETLVQGNQARPERDRIRVRTGIHQASALAEADDAYGAVMDIVERIKSRAEPGQVLVSESVCRALESETDRVCVFIDKLQGMGGEKEINVYRVVQRRYNATDGQGFREARIDSDLVMEVSRRDRSIELSVHEEMQRMRERCCRMRSWRLSGNGLRRAVVKLSIFSIVPTGGLDQQRRFSVV